MANSKCPAVMKLNTEIWKLHLSEYKEMWFWDTIYLLSGNHRHHQKTSYLTGYRNTYRHCFNLIFMALCCVLLCSKLRYQWNFFLYLLKIKHFSIHQWKLAIVFEFCLLGSWSMHWVCVFVWVNIFFNAWNVNVCVCWIFWILIWFFFLNSCSWFLILWNHWYWLFISATLFLFGLGCCSSADIIVIISNIHELDL